VARGSTIRWLPFVLCVALIALFSSQDAPKQDISGMISARPALVKAVRALPHVSIRYSERTYDNRKDPVQFIVLFLRKGAHAAIYAGLGLSFNYAVGLWGLTPARRWIVSAMVVACTGALDELHQTTVPGRSGLPLDVAIDLGGFAAASAIKAWIEEYLKARKDLGNSP